MDDTMLPVEAEDEAEADDEEADAADLEVEDD